MKKVLSLLILITLMLSIVACGVELEYYSDTNIPTFTCVTDVEVKKTTSSSAGKIYNYNCPDNKKESLAKKYMNYLKNKAGYAVVDAEDSYDFITLAKEGWGVIVDSTGENTIRVLPYKRSN